MKINKISILMAMEAEAQPLINSLRLVSQDLGKDQLPFKFYWGHTDNGILVELITAGKDPEHNVDNVGTQPATLMAYLAINEFKPDIVINAGTAGGFGMYGCRVGDVYLSKGFIFHDRIIDIPGFDKYGIGDYPSVDTSEIAKKLNLKTGKISTGNSLDKGWSVTDVMEQNGAIIKDMESAAIAWVCKTMNVPMFAVKAITDLFDIKEPAPRQFLKNLKMATDNLQKSVVEVVKTLNPS